MDIETALMTHLLAQSAVTALVARRIHYLKAPQNVGTPYIVVTKISGPRKHSHDGSSQLAHPRFQFSCFAKTYGGAKGVTAALQTALQGYSGTMGGGSGVAVGNVIYEDETDLDPGENNELFGVGVDYIIWHKDS